jgi:Calcium binding
LRDLWDKARIKADVMSNTDEHLWDMGDDDESYSPEANEAFEKKLEEWQARNWMEWLGQHLSFPFRVTREEDDDDAYFSEGAAKSPFRLGHKMEALALEEEDIDIGIIITVREKGQTGCIPLADVEVKPKSDKNFWPVREYVVWFANK